nr:MAG TPA: hypothetical protein [Caudoviricetes sp.]
MSFLLQYSQQKSLLFLVFLFQEKKNLPVALH